MPAGCRRENCTVFDTSRPDKVIALGLRAGMNSSGVATNYMDKQPELIQSNFIGTQACKLVPSPT